MFDFISNIVDAVVDFFTGGDAEEPEPNPCDVGNCLQERDRLAAARRDARTACSWLGFIRAMLIIPEWIVTRSPAELLGIVIVAFLLAGPLGLVAVLLAYGFSLLFIRAMIPAIRGAAEAFLTATVAEQEAIAAVTAECPEECRGNTDPSECPHLDADIVIPPNPFDRFLGR